MGYRDLSLHSIIWNLFLGAEGAVPTKFKGCVPSQCLAFATCADLMMRQRMHMRDECDCCSRHLTQLPNLEPKDSNR